MRPTAVSSPHTLNSDTQQVEYVGLLTGFTAVFVGYFAVWLPGPSAGLQFIGVEMGEWLKFLGVDMSRNLFYLPPITLGALLVLWTGTWSNRRWQTWMMRGIGFAVSWLAFPAWEDINGPVQVEYMPRIWWIGAVLLLIGLAAFWRLRPFPTSMLWLLMTLLAILGLVLPTWIYQTAKPVVEQIMQMSLGTGLGVWLNGVGHLLIAAVSIKKVANGK